VSGGLRRDKGVQQALIETKQDAKTPGNTFPGFLLSKPVPTKKDMDPNGQITEPGDLSID